MSRMFHHVDSQIRAVWFGLVYWGLTPQQQPGSYQGGEMMMMKSVFWWRKPENPETSCASCVDCLKEAWGRTLLTGAWHGSMEHLINFPKGAVHSVHMHRGGVGSCHCVHCIRGGGQSECVFIYSLIIV